jgi:hypothetical protein
VSAKYGSFRDGCIGTASVLDVPKAEPNPEDFSASLVMSDGSPSGAVLRLRSMFEVFAAQIAEDDG